MTTTDVLRSDDETIPITPGGLGVVELGLIARLTAAGGDEAQVAAAC